MITVPIVYAFDNQLTMPVSISIFSLLMNANEDTFYDIFILHSEKEMLDKFIISKVTDKFQNCKVTYRTVGDIFDDAFEIRGITTPAYYRLLIPTLIPEYEKIIYSDADIIFRQDLATLYCSDLNDNYVAGVKDPGINLTDDGRKHIATLPGVILGNYINSGFLLINSDRINCDGIVDKFVLIAKNRWKFQDQDTINIVCSGRIKFLPPKFNMTDYVYNFGINNPEEWVKLYSLAEFQDGIESGCIHYNGHKPWKKWSVNFDIWWEYYRKSPVFESKFYFDFFNQKINELDYLSLWKRVKILVRWFLVH